MIVISFIKIVEDIWIYLIILWSYMDGLVIIYVMLEGFF